MLKKKRNGSICGQYIVFNDRGDAMNAARLAGEQTGKNYASFKCPMCNKWHYKESLVQKTGADA